MNKQPYTCRLFLQKPQDRQLLKPGRRLYGAVIESLKRVFITPYEPVGETFRWIGMVQGKAGYEQENPLLMNLLKVKKGYQISGFIGKHHVEMPVKVVYMAGCYERTPFDPAQMETLWQQKVMIIGGGTGGSKIALELARAGVGQLTVCDPQKLDDANISRHEGDLLDVGKPKVEVIAERIYRINPAITVKRYFEDIFELSQKRVYQIISGHDLIVAATDKTEIQLVINELAHKLKIACVFGGCYEEALGGEVFFTLPERKMPCLACLRAGLKQPDRNHEIDYSTAAGPDDYQGQPGLHAAVDWVTCVEIQVCLAILLRQNGISPLAKLINDKSNFILIGSGLAQGFYRFQRPFEVFYQPLKGPKSDCMVCQDLKEK